MPSGHEARRRAIVEDCLTHLDAAECALVLAMKGEMEQAPHLWGVLRAELGAVRSAICMLQSQGSAVIRPPLPSRSSP